MFRNFEWPGAKVSINCRRSINETVEILEAMLGDSGSETFIL